MRQNLPVYYIVPSDGGVHCTHACLVSHCARQSITAVTSRWGALSAPRCSVPRTLHLPVEVAAHFLRSQTLSGIPVSRLVATTLPLPLRAVVVAVVVRRRQLPEQASRSWCFGDAHLGALWKGLPSLLSPDPGSCLAAYKRRQRPKPSDLIHHCCNIWQTTGSSARPRGKRWQSPSTRGKLSCSAPN